MAKRKPGTNTRQPFTFQAKTLQGVVDELNRWQRLIATELDQQSGALGTPTFQSSPDFRGHRITKVGTPTDDDDAEVRGLSLRRPGPGEPFDAGAETINNVADPRAPMQAVNLRTLESKLGKTTLHISTAVPVQVDAGDTGQAGANTSAVSGAFHEHPVGTGETADIVAIGATADGGTSTDISRADHRHPLGRPFSVVLTASLPAAGAGMDGTILIEDGGAGNRNLIIYAESQRFRIDGGAAI